MLPSALALVWEELLLSSVSLTSLNVFFFPLLSVPLVMFITKQIITYNPKCINETDNIKKTITRVRIFHWSGIGKQQSGGMQCACQVVPECLKEPAGRWSSGVWIAVGAAVVRSMLRPPPLLFTGVAMVTTAAYRIVFFNAHILVFSGQPEAQNGSHCVVRVHRSRGAIQSTI